MDRLVLAFHRAARISRAALYLTETDSQLPVHLRDDARSPFLGFLGEGWCSGGTVFLAINPGGGRAAYQSRTPQDQELIPLIQEFLCASPESVTSSFRRMSASYRTQVQTWNLWRILGPTLEACHTNVDDVCYLNIFPYRTADDAKPIQLALQNAWIKIVAPLLDQLQPGRLVALGKKAGDVAERLHTPPPPLYIVPRTIGDTYVSEQARRVLDQLRKCKS